MNLATVRKIKSLEPIEGADRIELVKFENLGWQCVVQKGIHSVGDLVVYIGLDAIVPQTEIFSFMEKSKWRVKTMKLKRVLSQGIVIPVKELGLVDVVEGQDVTEVIGVTKYEKEVPIQPNAKVVLNPFPSFIPKTDEIRIQNFPEILEKYNDVIFEARLKIDGTSSTYYLKDGEFGICSRNRELTEIQEDNVYSRIAEKYKLKDLLGQLATMLGDENYSIALQAECAGPGIQGNPQGLREETLFVFDVFNITKGEYLAPRELESFLGLQKLGVKNPELAPVVDYFRLSEHTMDTLLELAKGNTLVGDLNRMREGIVCRPFFENIYDNNVGGRLSFKVINNDYKD